MLPYQDVNKNSIPSKVKKKEKKKQCFISLFVEKCAFRTLTCLKMLVFLLPPDCLLCFSEGSILSLR